MRDAAVDPPENGRTGTVRSARLDFPRGGQRLQLTVWDDGDGTIVRLTLRGYEIEGGVDRGDHVRFVPPVADGPLDHLTNLTTGEEVVVLHRSWAGAGGRLFGNALVSALAGSVVSVALATAGHAVAGDPLGIAFHGDTALWTGIIVLAMTVALVLAFRTRRRLPAVRHPVALTAVVTSVATFAVTLGLLAAARSADLGVLSSGHDVTAQKRLTRALQDLGGVRCHPMTVHRIPRESVFLAAVNADAGVSCDTVVKGAATLAALHFARDADFERYELDNHHYVAGPDAAGECDSDAYSETAWASVHGGVRGTLYCEPDSHRGVLVWTDRRARRGFALWAQGSEMKDLIAWWRAHVKHAPTGVAASRPMLDRLFDGAVVSGLADCTASGDALADLALLCGAKTPTGSPRLAVSTLAVFHFPDAAARQTFFGNYKTRFHAPSETKERSCGKNDFASYSWAIDAKHRGSVFCFPYGTTEWLVWTIDAENVAVVISRIDQDAAKLGDAWQALPPL